jgi:hypothetical protein
MEDSEFNPDIYLDSDMGEENAYDNDNHHGKHGKHH